MAAYAILRCQKLKNFGSFGGAVQHCFRERDTPNADDTKTKLNTHYYAESETDAFKRLRERLPEKIRKNGVIAVEYMITASPEFFEKATEAEKSEFFKRSVDWLKTKYGEENIVVATVHNDEKTPHMSAFVVPIDKRGKLNARGFIGSRELLSQDQDSFAEKVADLGLSRGIKGSKAKHQTIQQYYANLNKTMTTTIAPGTLKKKLFESEDQFVKRANETLLPIATKASQFDQEHKRVKSLESVISDKEENISELNKKLTTYHKSFTAGLTLEQIELLARQATALREQNLKKKLEVQKAQKIEKTKSRNIKDINIQI